MWNQRRSKEWVLILIVIFLLVNAYNIKRTDTTIYSNSSVNDSRAQNKSVQDSTAKANEDLRLFRMAFDDAKIEELIQNISTENDVPAERLHLLKANMFFFRFFGQKSTKNTAGFMERSFWAVEIRDNGSGRIYEAYIRDGTIMNSEQSGELSSYFKEYGKMESDLHSSLAGIRDEDWINVIIWPVVVYPTGYDPEDYIPETTVEYFLMVKGYGFSILEPIVYGAQLPDDIILELQQRKDIDTVTPGEKIGNNTHVIIRLKPTVVDEEIMPLEGFILNKTTDITFMKPVFFVNATKNTVLELNNRSDVANLAMQHVFHDTAQVNK